MRIKENKVTEELTFSLKNADYDYKLAANEHAFREDFTVMFKFINNKFQGYESNFTVTCPVQEIKLSGHIAAKALELIEERKEQK